MGHHTDMGLQSKVFRRVIAESEFCRHHMHKLSSLIKISHIFSHIFLTLKVKRSMHNHEIGIFILMLTNIYTHLLC